MDPNKVLAEAKDALGVERTSAQAALATSRLERHLEPSARPRKRPAASGLAREPLRAVWRGFVFSVSMDALSKGNRERGPKEKMALQTMQKQRAWIGTSIRTRTLALGPAGHEFVRALWGKYERSVASLRVIEPAEKEAAASFGDEPSRCVITKKAVGATDTCRVLIRYRCTQGIIRDALPMIMTREWAARARAWHVIMSLDDAIAERAHELLNAHETGELSIPQETMAHWNHRTPAISQLVAQSDELFFEYRDAVAGWLQSPPANVWPGWFEK